MAQPVDDTYHDAILLTPSANTVYNPPLRKLWIGAGATNATVTVVTAAAMAASQITGPTGATNGSPASLVITGCQTGATIPIAIAQLLAATGASTILGLC